MRSLSICGLRFGEGLPKICVPLTGHGMPALLSEIQYVQALPADFYEWRADCFFGDPLDALPALSQGLKDKPVLCTVRTLREGGKADLSPAEYEELATALLERGGFQMVDIELSCGEERVRRLVSLARRRGTAVVISQHDFERTPPADVLFETMTEMKALDADLPKVAVMPQTPQDVLSLLEATLRAREKLGPVVTMAMGSLGKISRVSGAYFGSCVTFAAGKEASAPGQIEAEDLRAILEDLDLEA